MKLNSLTHFRGEQEVKAILERSLERTKFQVWGKVRLRSVIGKEPGESLPEDLFDYLTRAELDYVVLRREHPNPPFLGVEFDGPHHETDPKTQKRDRLKNRLCRMAGLPLLRVRYRDVEPLFKRDTFLSNVIDVVLRYQNSLECPEYSKTYGEIARHDLPDIQRLRDRLARRHRIGCLHPTDGSEFVYQFNLGTSDYGSSETDEIHEGHMVLLRVAASVPAEEWPVAHRISKVLSLTTHYRTTEEPRPAWPKDGFDLASMQAYVKWLETDPWYFPDVPGVNWFYVAWNVPEALCVKQLLADADRGTFNCLLSRICG